MNEPTSPLSVTTSDPIDAAIQAAQSLSSEKAPTPALPSETPAQANVEGKPEQGELQANQQKVEARYAQAAEAKRRAAQAESRARQLAKEARDQQTALAQEKADLEALFTGAKGNKATLQKLMDRAGLTLDDIARTALEMDLEVPSVDSVAKRALEEAQSLRKELADRDAAIEEQKLVSQQKAAYSHYLARVEEEILKEATDKYELIKDNQAYPQVLDRCLQTLKEKNWTDPLTPEDEVFLVNHCAQELETELFKYAETAAQKLQKSKKLQSLLGITTHNNTGTDPTRNNDIASIDPEAARLLESMAQETTQANGNRSNRFLTNDTTISARPSVVVRKAQSDSDLEIDELIKALSGQKPSF